MGKRVLSQEDPAVITLHTVHWIAILQPRPRLLSQLLQDHHIYIRISKLNLAFRLHQHQRDNRNIQRHI